MVLSTLLKKSRRTKKAIEELQRTGGQVTGQGLIGNIIGNLFAGDPDEKIRELEELLKRLEAALDAVGSRAADAGLAVTLLSESTEKSKGLLGDLFNKELLSVVNLEDGMKSIQATLGGVNVEIGRITQDGKLSDTFSEAGVSVAEALLKVENLTEKLNKGIISPETASRDIGVIENLADLLEVISNALGDPERFNGVEKLVEDARDAVNEFTMLDNLGKNLAKTFGSASKFVDDSLISGRVGLDGSLARTPEEMLKNRSELLKSIKEARENQDLLNLSTSDLAELDEAIIAAKNAAVASNIKNVEVTAKLARQEEKRLATLVRQGKILDVSLQVAQAEFAIEQQKLRSRVAGARADNEIKIQEKILQRGKEIARLNEQIRKSKLESLKLDQRALEIQARITATSREIADTGARAADERALRNLEAEIADNQRRTVTTRKQVIQDELRLEMMRQNNIIKDVDRRIAAAKAETNEQLAANKRRREVLNLENDLATQRINDQLSILDKERQINDLKREAEKADLLRQKTILEAELAALPKKREEAALRIQAALADQVAGLKIIDERYALLEAEITANNAFIDAENKILEGFAKVATALGKPVTVQSAGKISSDQIGAARGSIAGQITEAQGQAQTKLDIANTNFDKQAAGLQANIAILDDNIITLGRLQELEGDIFDTKEAALVNELGSNSRLLSKKLSNLNLEDAAIRKQLELKLLQLGIERQVAEEAIDLAKKRARFELSFQARLSDAYQSIYDTTNNKLVDGLLQLNDAFIEGTLTLDNFMSGFKDFIGSLIKEIQRIFFTKTIAEPAAEFLSKSVMSGFTTEAEGGPVVKMASGGMLRDRVPALLEPGEFVIRRPAAKAIGGPALGAMNATGKMPGDVSINIQNEGSPKDAEAQQPRFDGEKFVIDVVMRDLNNNGPIRKSLRAGG